MLHLENEIHDRYIIGSTGGGGTQGAKTPLDQARDIGVLHRESLSSNRKSWRFLSAECSLNSLGDGWCSGQRANIHNTRFWVLGLVSATAVAGHRQRACADCLVSWQLRPRSRASIVWRSRVYGGRGEEKKTVVSFLGYRHSL